MSNKLNEMMAEMGNKLAQPQGSPEPPSTNETPPAAQPPQEETGKAGTEESSLKPETQDEPKPTEDQPAGSPQDESEEGSSDEPQDAETTSTDVEDFDFSSLDEPESDPAQPQAPSVDWGSIAQEAGLSNVKDQESLVGELKSLREKLSTYESIPGFTPDVIQAVREGLVDPAEIMQGQLFVDYGEGMTDREMALEYLAHSNSELSDEELMEELDNMSKVQVKMASDFWKQKNQGDREKLINTVREKTEQFRRQQEAEQMRAIEVRQQAAKEINEALGQVNDLNGFKVTPDMKKNVERIANDPQALRKLMFGGGRAEVAVKNLIRMAYAGSIEKAQRSAGKQEGKKEVIDSAKNLDIEGRKGTAPTAKSSERANLLRQGLDQDFANMFPHLKKN